MNFDDNFETCQDCGNQRPVNTPGCPSCETTEAEAAGHSGWFDLLNGWTCHIECPQCHPDTEMEEKPCIQRGCPHWENFPVIGACKPDFDDPEWHGWLSRRNAGEIVGRSPGTFCNFWEDAPGF